MDNQNSKSIQMPISTCQVQAKQPPNLPEKPAFNTKRYQIAKNCVSENTSKLVVVKLYGPTTKQTE